MKSYKDKIHLISRAWVKEKLSIQLVSWINVDWKADYPITQVQMS